MIICAAWIIFGGIIVHCGGTGDAALGLGISLAATIAAVGIYWVQT